MKLLAAAVLLAPPSFAPAPGWVTTTTGPTSATEPAVWAAPARSALAGVRPREVYGRLRRLGPHGILIGAGTIAGGAIPHDFPRARLPLRLSSFRIDRGWEGQPAARIQQRLLGVRVGRWRLDVRVYFGTQRPSHALLSRAQAELSRLRLPAR
jgi:hypothetical protein